jgi:predicted ATP-dependent serine protease
MYGCSGDKIITGKITKECSVVCFKTVLHQTDNVLSNYINHDQLRKLSVLDGCQRRQGFEKEILHVVMTDPFMMFM